MEPGTGAGNGTAIKQVDKKKRGAAGFCILRRLFLVPVLPRHLHYLPFSIDRTAKGKAFINITFGSVI